MGVVFTLGRVDVQTSDYGISIEDRVGEAFAAFELLGVHLHVCEVLFESHRRRPLPPLHPRRGSDVLDARHPCFVVTFVVGWPKWLEMEARAFEAGWGLELMRHEILGHRRNSTGSPVWI